VAYVFRLILGALVGSLAWVGASFAACVDQATYDINESFVGTHWLVQINNASRAPYTGTSGTCANNTLAGVMACGRAAVDAVFACAGTRTWAAITYYSSTDRRQTWSCEGYSGGQVPNGSIRSRRNSSSWPAGYEHCVIPDTYDCSALANVKTLAVGTGKPDSFVPGNTGCVTDAEIGGQPVDMAQGCAVFKRAEQRYKRLGSTNQREWLVAYQFTGLACDAEPAVDLTVDDDPVEKCKTGPGGLTWCEQYDAEGDCGFFNDKYVCLQSLGEDRCEAKADGSRICPGSAPSPPVPDNGTAGVPATPSDTITVTNDDNSTTNYNYYNSTVVGTSSRDPGTGSGTGGSGTVGPGGDAVDPNEGSASGGVTCDSEPACSGDPIQCAILKQQWRTRCVETPTEAEALGAIEATEGEIDGTSLQAGEVDVTTLNATGTLSGSCPVPLSISVMGQNLSLDIWSAACDMAVLFAPFVMAMGYFLSAMLFIKGLRV